MSLDNTIKEIKASFKSDLSSCNTSTDLENIRIKYLGRKGKLTTLFEEFTKLPGSEKPKYGKTLNILKNDLTNAFNKKLNELSPNKDISNDKSEDFSLPGYKLPQGSLRLRLQPDDREDSRARRRRSEGHHGRHRAPRARRAAHLQRRHGGPVPAAVRRLARLPGVPQQRREVLPGG